MRFAVPILLALVVVAAAALRPKLTQEPGSQRGPSGSIRESELPGPVEGSSTVPQKEPRRPVAPAPPSSSAPDTYAPHPAPTYKAHVTQADEHYKLAERHYHAGEFGRALEECDIAIQHDPNHAAASALKTEVRWILNDADKHRASRMILEILEKRRGSQVLAELEKKLAKGKRHYYSGEYADALKEFSDVVTYARWMPTGTELERHRGEAEYWLGCLGVTSTDTHR